MIIIFLGKSNSYILAKSHQLEDVEEMINFIKISLLTFLLTVFIIASTEAACHQVGDLSEDCIVDLTD